MQTLDNAITNYIEQVTANRLSSAQEISAFNEFVNQGPEFINAIFRLIQQYPQYIQFGLLFLRKVPALRLSQEQAAVLLNLAIVDSKYSKLAIEILCIACGNNASAEIDEVIVEFIKQMHQQKNYKIISLLIKQLTVSQALSFTIQNYVSDLIDNQLSYEEICLIVGEARCSDLYTRCNARIIENLDINEDAGLTYLIQAIDFSEVLFLEKGISSNLLSLVTKLLVKGQLSGYSEMTHNEMEFIGTVLSSTIGEDQFSFLAIEQQKFIFESIFTISSGLSMDYVLDDCQDYPLHILYSECLQRFSNHFLLIDCYRQELFGVILETPSIEKVVAAVNALHEYPFQSRTEQQTSVQLFTCLAKYVEKLSDSNSNTANNGLDSLLHFISYQAQFMFTEEQYFGPIKQMCLRLYKNSNIAPNLKAVAVNIMEFLVGNGCDLQNDIQEIITDSFEQLNTDPQLSQLLISVLMLFSAQVEYCVRKDFVDSSVCVLWYLINNLIGDLRLILTTPMTNSDEYQMKIFDEIATKSIWTFSILTNLLRQNEFNQQLSNFAFDFMESIFTDLQTCTRMTLKMQAKQQYDYPNLEPFNSICTMLCTAFQYDPSRAAALLNAKQEWLQLLFDILDINADCANSILQALGALSQESVAGLSEQIVQEHIQKLFCQELKFQHIFTFLITWNARLQLSQQIQQNTRFGEATSLLIKETLGSQFTTQDALTAVSVLLCILDKNQFELECFALYPDSICQALISVIDINIWRQCLERMLIIRNHISPQQLNYCKNSYISAMSCVQSEQIPQDIQNLADQVF